MVLTTNLEIWRYIPTFWQENDIVLENTEIETNVDDPTFS